MENRILKYLDMEGIHREFPSTSHRFQSSLSPVKDKNLTLSPPMRGSMLSKRRESMMLGLPHMLQCRVSSSNVAQDASPDPLDNISLAAIALGKDRRGRIS